MTLRPSSQRSASDRISNPFASRWVRPGALPYLFSDGGAVEGVIEKLELHGGRGAIVGPHGTGKSTLLVTLKRHFESARRDVEFIPLRDRQRRLPSEFWSARAQKRRCLILVDGFEQLNWWNRRRLLRACFQNECGLIVTAHRAAAVAGLPVIHQTFGDPLTLQSIIDDWLPAQGGVIRSDEVSQAFLAHHGNLRETMFALYELFEQRRRAMHALSNRMFEQAGL